MTKQGLSVILPTYNEIQTICQLVEKIRSVISSMRVTFEILVVDDSSPDGTADVVRNSFSGNPGVRVISRNAPRSLGASIKDGILAAREELILMMDADFNHSPDDIPRFFDWIDKFDVVNGSRFLPGGGMSKARARYWGSYFFNCICRIILSLPVTDVLSGFILARKDMLLSVDMEKIFSGYGDFAIRLHYVMKQRKWNIKEIPVQYLVRLGGSSKTRFLKHTLQYSRSALEARSLFRE